MMCFLLPSSTSPFERFFGMVVNVMMFMMVLQSVTAMNYLMVNTAYICIQVYFRDHYENR